MAELADAYGSGPYESNFMQVQVLLSAPNENNPNLTPIGDGFGFVYYFQYPIVLDYYRADKLPPFVDDSSTNYQCFHYILKTFIEQCLQQVLPVWEVPERRCFPYPVPTGLASGRGLPYRS